MRFIIVFIGCILLISSLKAQRYVADRGEVRFFSEAPLEDISAVNHRAVSALDAKTGAVVFVVQIKDFTFDKALMQEHFNDKYMESEQFPKAIFNGEIEGFHLKKDTQRVKVVGEITIHGVTQPLEVEGSMTFDGTFIYVTSTFWLDVEAFEIEIPRLMWQKIAEKVQVDVSFKYQQHENTD